MLDFDAIKKLYQLGQNLTLADVGELLRAANRMAYPAGALLIKEGTFQKNLFFLQKGLVRMYSVNDKGNEITVAVRKENQVVASVDVLLFEQPSTFYFETLEPTEAYCIDYEVLQTLVSGHPKLEASRRFILLNLLKDLSYRVHSFVLHSPEERYLDFIKENPDLLNRVPNKYIANILGITPVSLSRIRKRIASRKK